MYRFSFLAIFILPLNRARRVVALGLSVVMLFTQVFFAHASEINFWEARQSAVRKQKPRDSSTPVPLLAQLINPHSVSEKMPNFPLSRFSDQLQAQASTQTLDTISHIAALAAPAATLLEIHLPTQGFRSRSVPVVVFIQDIHGHIDAQEKIATVLGRFHEWRPDALIGMEAAEGPVDAAPFRGPHADANHFVAEFFLKAGIIGGPEFAALTSPDPLPLFGVEDKSLYLANVAAVRGALPRQGVLSAKVLEIRQKTGRAARACFTDKIQSFGALTDAFADRSLSLGKFVTAMAALPDFHASEFPELGRFLQALKIESHLDAVSVERERLDMVKHLCAVASRKDLYALTSAGVAFQSGTIDAAVFYRILNEKAMRVGMQLSNYPVFKSYVEYLALADRLNAERVLAEAEGAEARIWQGLCQTNEQRRLVAERRDGRLLQKLIALSLTAADWSVVRERRGRLQLLAGAAELNHFEKFYEVAEARNNALADRLVAQMRSGGENTAALVAGGFHKEGLVKRFLSKGLAVVVLTPHLMDHNDPGEANYLSVFTRKKTPLSEIFDTLRISLANTPVLSSIDPSVRSDTGAMMRLASYLRAAFSLWKQCQIEGSHAVQFNLDKSVLVGDASAFKTSQSAKFSYGKSTQSLFFIIPHLLKITINKGSSLKKRVSSPGLAGVVGGLDVTVEKDADWFDEIFRKPFSEATETFHPIKFWYSHPFDGFWSMITGFFGTWFIFSGILVVPFVLGFIVMDPFGEAASSLGGLFTTLVSVFAGRQLASVKAKKNTLPFHIRFALIFFASPSILGSIAIHFVNNVFSNITRLLGPWRWAPLAKINNEIQVKQEKIIQAFLLTEGPSKIQSSFAQQRKDLVLQRLRKHSDQQQDATFWTDLALGCIRQGLPNWGLSLVQSKIPIFLDNPGFLRAVVRLFIQSAELALAQNKNREANLLVERALSLMPYGDRNIARVQRRFGLMIPESPGSPKDIALSFENRPTVQVLHLSNEKKQHIYEFHMTSRNNRTSRNLALFNQELPDLDLLSILKKSMGWAGEMSPLNSSRGYKEMIFYSFYQEAKNTCRYLMIVSPAGYVQMIYPTIGKVLSLFRRGKKQSTDEHANMNSQGGPLWNRATANPIALRWGNLKWGLARLVQDREAKNPLTSLSFFEREKFLRRAILEAVLLSENRNSLFYYFKLDPKEWKSLIDLPSLILEVDKKTFNFLRLHRTLPSPNHVDPNESTLPLPKSNHDHGDVSDHPHGEKTTHVLTDHLQTMPNVLTYPVGYSEIPSEIAAVPMDSLETFRTSDLEYYGIDPQQSRADNLQRIEALLESNTEELKSSIRGAVNALELEGLSEKNIRKIFGDLEEPLRAPFARRKLLLKAQALLIEKKDHVSFKEVSQLTTEEVYIPGSDYVNELFNSVGIYPAEDCGLCFQIVKVFLEVLRENEMAALLDARDENVEGGVSSVFHSFIHVQLEGTASRLVIDLTAGQILNTERSQVWVDDLDPYVLKVQDVHRQRHRILSEALVHYQNRKIEERALYQSLSEKILKLPAVSSLINISSRVSAPRAADAAAQTAMLVRAAQYGLVYEKAYEVFSGFWNEHLQKSRQMIRGGITLVARHDVATVLGASSLHDNPSADLAYHFDRLYIVDVDEGSLKRAIDSIPPRAVDKNGKYLRDKIIPVLRDITGGAVTTLIARGQEIFRTESDSSIALAKVLKLIEAYDPVPDLSDFDFLKASYVISSGLSTQLSSIGAAVLLDGSAFSLPVLAPYISPTLDRLRHRFAARHRDVLAALVSPEGRVYWADTIKGINPRQLTQSQQEVVRSKLKDFMRGHSWPAEILSSINTILQELHDLAEEVDALNEHGNLSAKIDEPFHEIASIDLLSLVGELIKQGKLHPDFGLSLMHFMVSLVREMAPDGGTLSLPGGLEPLFKDVFTEAVPVQRWDWFLHPDRFVTWEVEAYLLKKKNENSDSDPVRPMSSLSVIEKEFNAVRYRGTRA